MALNNDAKFEGKVIFALKTDMSNLTNGDPSTQKSLKCALQWALFDQNI